MGRKSLKDIRQKEIVIAFYKVAKKEGLENASIAKVAECLKVNPSLIIHYFKNRKELLNALVDFILKRYLEIYKLDGKINSREKLVALIDYLFSRNWHRLFDDGVFYSCYALIYRNNSIKEKYNQLHKTLLDKFYLALKEAQEHNIIQVQDVRQTSAVIFSMVDGAYFSLGMVQNKEELEEKASLYKQHVKNLLNLTE